MRAKRAIRIFTDKYPWLGPLVWVLSIQYFVAQALAASAWAGGYSWRFNLISDLGNTGCGPYSGRFVCSPENAVMNISFVMLGITMMLGSLLIYQEFKESRLSLAGFTLMGLAGFGTLLVGLFPENAAPAMHGSGAVLALLVGNAGLVVLSMALRRVRRAFRIYTFITGIFTVACFALFTAHLNLGLGQGGMERLVSYPQTIWLTLFGLYMSQSHLKAWQRTKKASAKS